MHPRLLLHVLINLESQLAGLEKPILAVQHLDDEGKEGLEKLKDIHHTLKNMYDHVHKIVESQGRQYAHIVSLYTDSIVHQEPKMKKVLMKVSLYPPALHHLHSPD